MGAVAEVTEILQTKIHPPRLHEIISRERLLEKLNVAATARLTAVVTGAGYGKSTLAADFLAAKGAPYTWYRLEDTDRDLFVFITYLIKGLSMVTEGSYRKTQERLHSVDNLDMESREILATLVSEMDVGIKDDVYITLDDFHEVNNSPSITNAIEYLLDHLPDNIHFLILSRSKLNLNLVELAAGRELQELGEEELRFSAEEISKLFTEVFKISLPDDYIQTLSTLTEGWIAGLVLFSLVIKDKKGHRIEITAGDLEAPNTQVAAYLLKAVYQNQNESVKEFLIKSSILSSINPEFCNQLMGIDHSGEVIDYLIDEHLFTVTIDYRGEWHRFHHLLKSFLLEQLKDHCSEMEIKELNRKAALLWERYNNLEQALFHYLEAEDYEDAARILETTAREFMESKRISFLHNQLCALPEDVLMKHPWLVFYCAETSDILGDYDKALEMYRDASVLFEVTVDKETQVLCLLLMARVLNNLGRFDEFRELIEKAQDIMPEGSPYWNVLMAFRSLSSTLAGVSDLARQCLVFALDHCNEIEDEIARFNLLSWCGLSAFLQCDYVRARKSMLDALELAERHNRVVVPLQLCMFLSQMDCIQGRFLEAVEIAGKGISIGEQYGVENPSTYSCRSNRGGALAILGDHETALRDARICSVFAEKNGQTLEDFNTEIMVGAINVICGDRTIGLKFLKNGERSATERGQTDIMYLSKVIIIFASIHEMGINKAESEVKTILDSLESDGIQLAHLISYQLLAFIAFIGGRKDDALGALEKLADFTEGIGGFGWWCLFCHSEVNHREPMADALKVAAEIFAEGKHLEHSGYIFSTVGAPSLSCLNDLVKNENPEVSARAKELRENIIREAAEPLRIKMLGPFKVMKGDEEIAIENWKSMKALSIFKYLAAQREGFLVSRDVLMEMLWPEVSPQLAAKSLNTALSSLRKTLEPQLGRGQSSYLITGRDSLSLNMGKGGSVDFKLFRKKLHEAKDTGILGDHDLYLESLRAAEELYRGDFLEADLYEDWCREERDSLREKYLRLLVDLCAEYMRRDDADQALAYSDKAIKTDPGREVLYRRRMELCSETGDRVGIERTYKKCLQYLKENFDVNPSPETEELYRSLRGE